MRTAARSALAVTLAVVALGVATFAQNRPLNPRTIGIDELRPGMRGYGLTVFHGTEPERFDVEVLEVLHDFRPRQDLVLIRPTHPIINRANAVGGMSGSPIYINDRLVGAYAYGWEYGNETVAGVTPIANMLNEARRVRRAPPGLLPGTQLRIPLVPEGDGEGGPARRDRTGLRNAGRRAAYDRTVEAMRLARAPVQTSYGALTPLAIPLNVTGMTPRAFERLRDDLAPLGFEPLQAGGGAGVLASNRTPAADAPMHYVNGGAVSIALSTGDITSSGIGTITTVEDGLALGFGHPMANLGETALPAAVSRVAWVLSTLRRSVKLGEPVRVVGSLVQDRPSTIIVDERVPAPMVPVRVRVTGNDTAAQSEWNAQVAYNRSGFSRLAYGILNTSLETVANDSADVAWVVRGAVTTATQGTLRFIDLGVADNGTNGMSSASLASVEALERLADNPFELVRVTRVEWDVELRWARDFYVVRSVAASRAEGNPGETVDLLVSLGRYGAPPEVRRVPLTLPREMAGRELEVEVSAGSETVPDLAEPESIGDLVRNLTTSYPEDALVVTVRMPGQGVLLRGRTLANLPGSALDALRPAASSDGGEPFVNTRRTVVSTGRVVLGRDRVRLRVREVRQ